MNKKISIEGLSDGIILRHEDVDLLKLVKDSCFISVRLIHDFDEKDYLKKKGSYPISSYYEFIYAGKRHGLHYSTRFNTIIFTKQYKFYVCQK